MTQILILLQTNQQTKNPSKQKLVQDRLGNAYYL